MLKAKLFKDPELPESVETDDPALAFAPVQEPYATEGVFHITGDVSSLFENAWGNNIELLVGQTSVEVMGVIVTIRLLPESLAIFGDFRNYIPSELNVKRNTVKSQKYGEMIKQVYYGVLQPSMTNIDGILFVET